MGGTESRTRLAGVSRTSFRAVAGAAECAEATAEAVIAETPSRGRRSVGRLSDNGRASDGTSPASAEGGRNDDDGSGGRIGGGIVGLGGGPVARAPCGSNLRRTRRRRLRALSSGSGGGDMTDLQSMRPRGAHHWTIFCTTMAQRKTRRGGVRSAGRGARECDLRRTALYCATASRCPWRRAPCRRDSRPVACRCDWRRAACRRDWRRGPSPRLETRGLVAAARDARPVAATGAVVTRMAARFE
jgi:hypothetical protein